MNEQFPGRGRPDATRKTPLTPEEEQARYLQIAQDALETSDVFRKMEEEARPAVIADAAEMVRLIALRARGRYRGTSADAVWSGLYPPQWKRHVGDSSLRFRVVLKDSALLVFRNAYAMLEAGVTTWKELSRLDNPVDPLDGVRGMGKRVRKGAVHPWK